MKPLTPPEDRASRDQGWQLVDRVRREKGCNCCRHRDKETTGWGLSICGLVPGKTFPRCVEEANGFSPDFAVLYGKVTNR